jgi:DNA-binding CsgD family transcriptional regulator/PAS domain-containing protein
VYRAAADETQWLPVLERLGDAFGGGVSGLQYRTGPEAQVRWGRFARLDPSLGARIVRDYATQNPWVRATQALWRPGVTIPTHHVVPVSDLRRTAFHDGILRPAGVEHAFGACVFRDGDNVLTFTVVRSNVKGAYEPHELPAVRALLPHINAAVQTNARLAALKHARGALADGLEQLHHAVFLVGRSGRVVFANRAARRIAGLHDGLSIDRDGLTAAAHEARISLRSLIDQAVLTSKGEGDSPGGTIRISRPSLNPAYHVLVAPVRLNAGAGSPGLATVFVTDPGLRPRVSEALAGGIYGLSAAEGRLVKALVETGSAERAADILGIAPGTARWHLKRIFRKTGARHQAALVARVLQASQGLAVEA